MEAASSSAGTPARGVLLVLSGPSGVGKTSIAHALLARFPGAFSVSATTRAAGPGEREGVDYFFIDRPTFLRWKEEGRFLETALVYGRDLYGTPREPVERVLAGGGLSVLDIDVQGAEQVRASAPAMLGVFILPPSEEDLFRRLRLRAREDEAAIERRVAHARSEIARARGGRTFDAFVVNDDLERAVDEVARLVQARLTA